MDKIIKKKTVDYQEGHLDISGGDIRVRYPLQSNIWGQKFKVKCSQRTDHDRRSKRRFL